MIFTRSEENVIHVVGKAMDLVITIEETSRPTWLGMAIGLVGGTQKRKYAGSGTVWYSLPGFKRCGTLREKQICGLLVKWSFTNMGVGPGRR